MNRSRIFACLSIGMGMLAALGAGCSSAGSPTLRSLVVSPSGSKVLAQQTVQLTATGSYSDGTTHDLTGEVSWTSSYPNVASVSDGGLVTGLAVGSSQIDATAATFAGGVAVTVVGP